MAIPNPTEVEIRVSEEGKIRPLRFRRGEVWMEIAQVGRRWSDDAGDHWLVMPMYPPQLFELTRTEAGLWQVMPSGPSIA